jgi:hypothetical protein
MTHEEITALEDPVRISTGRPMLSGLCSGLLMCIPIFGIGALLATLIPILTGNWHP